MNTARRFVGLARDSYRRDTWSLVTDVAFIAAIVGFNIWAGTGPAYTIFHVLFFVLIITWLNVAHEDRRQANERRRDAEGRVRVLERCRDELTKRVSLADFRADQAEHELAQAHDPVADVYRMCRVFGQDVHNELHKPDPKVRALRLALMAEEVKEYFLAEQQDNVVEIADGLADIVVIAAGTAAAYGIDLNACLAEVYRSNMSKVVDGEVERAENGKVLKPASYSPPNLADTIGFDENGPWGHGEGLTA